MSRRADMSPRTAPTHLTFGTGEWALALMLSLIMPACAAAPAPRTTGVVVDPEPAHVTPFGDLEILRHRAAMGLAGDVRAELVARLAAADKGAGDGKAPDPGRDALRGLAVELALVQGDAETAGSELDRLDRA